MFLTNCKPCEINTTSHQTMSRVHGLHVHMQCYTVHIVYRNLKFFLDWKLERSLPLRLGGANTRGGQRTCVFNANKNYSNDAGIDSERSYTACIHITIIIVVISLWTGELCRTATDKTEGEKSLFSTFWSRMEQTVVSGKKTVFIHFSVPVLQSEWRIPTYNKFHVLGIEWHYSRSPCH